MHPKVVLVVSRSHWRCLSCKLLTMRPESIDQHLQSSHPQVSVSFGQIPSFHKQTDASIVTAVKDSPSAFPDTVKALLSTKQNAPSCQQNGPMWPSPLPDPALECCCFSDGELDTNQTRRICHSLSLLGMKKKLGSAAVLEKPKPEVPVSASRNNSVVSVRRRRIMKKTSHPAAVARVRKVGKVEEISLLNSNSHCRSEEQLMEDCEKEERDTCAVLRRASRKRSTAKPATGSKFKSKKQKTRKTAIKQMAFLSAADTDTDDSLTVSKKDKALEQTAMRTKEEADGVSVKEESPDMTEIKTADGTADKKLTATRSKQTRKTGHTDKSSHQINKSNIATSCVPWLLDSGRKAGEKVTRKSRRPLLLEEKQALRELYGISMFDTLSTTPHINTTAESGYDCQSVHIKESAGSQANTIPSVERLPEKESAMSAYRHYHVNVISPETQDIFLHSSQTRQNIYPAYSGVHHHQQLQQHQSYIASTSEMYSCGHHLQQRSSVSMLQPHSHAPDSDKTSVYQLKTDTFPGQNVSVPSQSHHPMGTAATSAEHIAPPPLPDTVCSFNTSQADSGSQYASSNSCTAGDLSIHSVSFTYSQKPSVMSVSPTSLDKSVVVDNNPASQSTVCKTSGQSNSEYGQHQDVAAFNSLECRRCRQAFHGLHELNLHVFSVHETEKQGFCFFCGQDSVGMESLERHVRRHTACASESCEADLMFHDCRFCGEELQRSYSTVRSHYYQHHVAHVCSECYQVFKDMLAYKEHSATHQGRPVFCSICGAKFESVLDLDKHAPCSEDIWAEDGKGDQCFKCGLWCPNRAVVEAHRKQHRSQDDVEAYRQGAKVGFPCVSCEKVFKNKHACRRHIKMVHEGVSCYKHFCEYCGKGFLTKGHMRDHIALHHLNIRRYKCDYCDKQFVCSPTLRRHVRKEHTKHRPYQCQHCGERFFEKTPLQRHLTQHTGLAPFMCEHCGKGFYTRHSFNNHASTHSTVKDFVCRGCQKGFTRKYNLQAHVKICKMV